MPSALKVALEAGTKTSAGDCLRILEKAYRSIASASELKGQFSEIYQHMRSTFWVPEQITYISPRNS